MQGLPRCTLDRIESGKRQYVQCGYFADWFYRVGNSAGPREQSWAIAVAFPYASRAGVGRVGRAHVNAHTNSSNTGPRVVRRWPSLHGRYCRAKMGRGRTCAVSCLSTVTPPCPFLPSLPRGRPALPRPRYRFSFSVFATAKCHCFWRRALELRCSFNATRTARLSGVRSALVRLVRPRVADGTMVSMWTVDKWRRSGRFDFFSLN